MARDAVLAQNADFQDRPGGPRLFFYTFTDHIETSINALHRAIKLIDALKSESGFAAMPREIRRRIEAHSKRIPDIRNALEHIDSAIAEGEVEDGQPVMLAFAHGSTELQVGPHRIKPSDLANCLRSAYEIADAMYPTTVHLPKAFR